VIIGNVEIKRNPTLIRNVSISKLKDVNFIASLKQIPNEKKLEDKL